MSTETYHGFSHFPFDHESKIHAKEEDEKKDYTPKNKQMENTFSISGSSTDNSIFCTSPETPKSVLPEPRSRGEFANPSSNHLWNLRFQALEKMSPIDVKRLARHISSHKVGPDLNSLIPKEIIDEKLSFPSQPSVVAQPVLTPISVVAQPFLTPIVVGSTTSLPPQQVDSDLTPPQTSWTTVAAHIVTQQQSLLQQNLAVLPQRLPSPPPWPPSPMLQETAFVATKLSPPLPLPQLTLVTKVATPAPQPSVPSSSRPPAFAKTSTSPIATPIPIPSGATPPHTGATQPPHVRTTPTQLPPPHAGAPHSLPTSYARVLLPPPPPHTKAAPLPSPPPHAVATTPPPHARVLPPPPPPPPPPHARVLPLPPSPPHARVLPPPPPPPPPHARVLPPPPPPPPHARVLPPPPPPPPPPHARVLPPPPPPPPHARVLPPPPPPPHARVMPPPPPPPPHARVLPPPPPPPPHARVLPPPPPPPPHARVLPPPPPPPHARVLPPPPPPHARVLPPPPPPPHAGAPPSLPPVPLAMAAPPPPLLPLVKEGATPPPLPTTARLLNGGMPPLPPISFPNRSTAGPPPPPGVERCVQPKKATTKLKRSTQLSKLYRILKGKAEGRSFEPKSGSGRKSNGAGSTSGGKGSMADCLAEITKRSAHFIKIEEDVKNYSQPINAIITEINKFQTKDITELLQFHQKVESLLENLSDETQVLARFEDFPQKKLEALRSAAATYMKLHKILTEMQNWKLEPPMNKLLEKVETYFTKVKLILDAVERNKDEDMKEFKSHNIHFDFQILVQIKEAMVDISSNCMELALEAKASKPIGCGKILWRAFQFAFRVYSFAGGQDDRAENLTNELAYEIQSVPDELQ